MTTSNPNDDIDALDVIADLPADDYARATKLQEAATSGEMLKWRVPAYVTEDYPSRKKVSFLP